MLIDLIYLCVVFLDAFPKRTDHQRCANQRQVENFLNPCGFKHHLEGGLQLVRVGLSDDVDFEPAHWRESFDDLEL